MKIIARRVNSGPPIDEIFAALSVEDEFAELIVRAFNKSPTANSRSYYLVVVADDYVLLGDRP